MKRALLSVWNKEGIIDLARTLHQAGVELLSSGGTAKVLTGAGIPSLRCQNIPGFLR
jgi:phosphoribosylaminoimidazolecarboxamide formyltransferase/IMP cyclohydrolase